ncbi:c-type cytochrome [Antarctobacter sp.]|uniref:c-type cytochrome n=1 Tax=Antarctobacter sp. TaxID=1872577 RepID=UPI002B271FEC|nr:c-type cytochrome [Antarctobacter sp.]
MRTAVALLALTVAPAWAGHELDNRDLTNGQTLYAENCAACHGANLEGQPDWQSPGPDGVLPAPPHDANGHTWHHSNAQLFEYTQLGGAEVVKRLGVKGFNSGMPGFGDALSDDDIWDILAYIRSTWPERERDVQAGRNPPHG